MKHVITFLALLSSFCGFSQEVRTTLSQNGDYFLQSVSYEDFRDKTLGKTTVYSADSVELYSIDRFFETHLKRHIVLSNDGTAVCYIKQKEWSERYEDQKGIILYKNGTLFREYAISDLISCDNDTEECNFTFWKAIEDIDNRGGRNFTFKPNTSEFEKFLCDTNIHVQNNTVSIFTDVDSAIVLDLATGLYNKKPFSDYSRKELIESYSLPNSHYQNRGSKKCFQFPKLTSGTSIEQAIAKGLGMRIYPENGRMPWQYYKYSLSLKCLIDTSGNAQIVSIEADDHISETKLDSLFKHFRFDTSCLLKHADKTAFNLIGFGLMNASKKESKEEQKRQDQKEKEEYEARLVKDTINGFYIPRNLGECFNELNSLLKQKDIDEMKNLASRDDMIQYHHGLGTYLRNNWGLWAGSRLRTYFADRGVRHPDSISSLILEHYHDWLNGRTETWKEWETETDKE